MLTYAKYKGDHNHKEEHKGKNRGEEEEEEPGGVWRM